MASPLLYGTLLVPRVGREEDGRLELHGLPLLHGASSAEILCRFRAIVNARSELL